MRSYLALGAILLGLGRTPISASADEIWIAPGEKASNILGVWSLTPSGTAHFTFTVPDSLDRFEGAQLMVISRKSLQISYELHLSIANNGERLDAFTADATGLSARVDANTLVALDASSVFPELVPGEDTVALHFRGGPSTELRVVGLRFQFTRFPDQAGLDCPLHEVLIGFAAETGAPLCLDRHLLLEGLLCPPRQFLIGFNPVTGQTRCGDKRVLLAGLSCPPGHVLVGFDESIGEPLCATLEEVSSTAPSLTIDDLELPEGNTNTTSFVFNLHLSEPSETPLVVLYSTRDGTAQAGSDYIPTSGGVTFAPGEVEQHLTVLVNGDTTVEQSEVLYVDLTDESGRRLGEATGRILNDDVDNGRD